jgi:hypothetical protein
MLRRLMEVAPIAALLAIGVPQPSAQAMSAPTMQSDEAIVLVGEDRRRGEGRSSRSERGGRDRDRSARGDRDDGPRFRRDDDRDVRRHRRRDGRDGFFGFGPRYDGECQWLRRRATETGSSYWWRRYRSCARGW